MDIESKWLLTDEEKDSFIATLTPNLTVLRTKAEISQEELANLIGVSRQTYSAIERKVRRMAWSVTIHSRPKPVKWKTKEIIFCLKANQRLSGRCDLSGC